MRYTGSVVMGYRLSRCGTQAQQMRYTGSVDAVHRLSRCGSQALQLWFTGSVFAAHRFSCLAACGILLDQGSNLYPLHWQTLIHCTTREVPKTMILSAETPGLQGIGCGRFSCKA